jgi:hypothetical protein
MNPFKSEKLIPISVPDLAPMAQELQAHFEQRRYQVECQLVPPGVWEVGVTRGGMFKTAMGLRSSMKVQLKGVDGGTLVQARVGIFGKQAIPTMVTMLVLWQMIFLQTWTVIRESALDDEAVRVVQISLTRHQRAAGADRAGPAVNIRVPAQGSGPRPCTGCGTDLDELARFCPHCGQTKVA